MAKSLCTTRVVRRWYMVFAAAIVTTGMALPTPRAAHAVDGTVHGHVKAPVGPLVTSYCSQPEQGLVGWKLDSVTPGWLFSLTSAAGASGVDLDVTFFSGSACTASAKRLFTHANRPGDEYAVVPPSAASAIVTLNVGADADFTFVQTSYLADLGPALHHSPTVVAVVDPEGFNPYHFDFLGSKHPWNNDADTAHNLDFDLDPATYITGYPQGVPALNITPPALSDQLWKPLKDSSADAAAWRGFAVSQPDDVTMYRIPQTKIIGAVAFGGGFFGDNNSHGTRSAASAAGNIHGTCPECLLVLVAGTGGLEWATQQSWIDVVSNSYGGHAAPPVGAKSVLEPKQVVYDEVETAPGWAANSEAAVRAGQSVVWSAGNGLLNAGDAPPLTYTSSMKGPDWVVTVGGVDDDGQNVPGSGKPVDISGPASGYPSTGGPTAAASQTAGGEGEHTGTSNASPVVAGTIAKVLQMGRDLLGDDTGGHSLGTVAEGVYQCGTTNATCPLVDGRLTRKEVEDVVFQNVLPSPMRVPTVRGFQVNDVQARNPALPTTPYGYAYLGHGIVFGKADPSRLALVNEHFRQVLTGDLPPAYPRPAGEELWMKVDSKCRQHLWPASEPWLEGYYTGTLPALDALAEPLATAWDAWCSAAPEGVVAELGGSPLG
jgi:hypothetical protein